MSSKQVWSWNKFQRKSDSLMNKAYVLACKRLVQKATPKLSKSNHILDVGAGSGLVLRFIKDYSPSDFTYTGIDLSAEGLSLLVNRSKRLNVEKNVEIKNLDISEYYPEFFNRFDLIFSNFCLYTISETSKRNSALLNIKKYLKTDGFFYIALPTLNYSASNIAIQCMKDELADRSQNLFLKFFRLFILVPYQWIFVLRPIEARVSDGEFLKFSKAQIESEFEKAGLKIDNMTLDYGGCGFHVVGSKLRIENNFSNP